MFKKTPYNHTTTLVSIVNHHRRRHIPTSPPSRSQMSRSATELTRFTATAPHAYAYAKTYAKTSALRNVFSPAQSKNRQPQPHSLPSHRSPQFNASSSISHRNSTLSSPPPSSETPAEKVARLRAARFKARFAQIPLWDRVVVEGRIWADRAHRITVLFLLIASGMCFF